MREGNRDVQMLGYLRVAGCADAGRIGCGVYRYTSLVENGAIKLKLGMAPFCDLATVTALQKSS